MKKLLFMCLCVCMIFPIGTFAQSADTDDQQNTNTTAQESSEAVDDSDIVFDPDTDWSAPEPLNNDVNCFDYYKFQSVSVSVGPDQLEYQPDSTVQFTGTIYNENDYPIFDGALFVRIGKKNDNAFTEGQYIVDEFIAAEDIAIDAKSEKNVEFTWDVPLYRDNGTYVVDYFFSAGKKYTLGGLSFSNEILAGTASFDIGSTITDFVSFEKSKTLFNGEPYKHIGSWPNVPAGSDVVITQSLRNSFDYEKIVNITQELYRWDALYPDDKISEKTYPLTIPADTTKEITYTMPETSDAVYYIRTTATYDEDVHSIITTRFSTDATRARLNFPALTKFPLEKGDTATLFTCFHNSTIGSAKGSIHVVAQDRNGAVIDEVNYDGEIPSAMSAIKKDLTAQKKYDYITLHATITDESGKTVDSYDVIYDCEKIGMCAQGQKQSLWSTMLRWGAYILFVVVSIVIVVVLINMLKKKRMRGSHVSIVGIMLLCGVLYGHAVDAAGNNSWAQSHNYTLRQTSDESKYAQSLYVQTLVTSGFVTLTHNMSASTVTPECNGNTTFTYTPELTYAASDGDIGTPPGTFCNNNFPNCFTNISTIGQTIKTGNSSSAIGYVHWTAIKPTVTLSSDKPSLMTCSGMTCTAAPGKSGTVTITATTSKTQGRIWANVSLDRTKYKDAMSKVTPGSVLGMSRVPNSGRVWYSPTEDSFRPWGTASGTGEIKYGWRPNFKTVDFESTNRAQWKITIKPCQPAACNPAATRLDYPFTAAGPSTPLCAAGTPSPVTVMFPDGKYGSSSKVTWICKSTDGGADSPLCEAARLAPAAACGTAAGVETYVPPSMNLCGAGTTLVNPPGVHLEGNTWRWSCKHNIVGAAPQVAECSAPTPPKIDGACLPGSPLTYDSYETEFTSPSLCLTGTADADMSTEAIEDVPFPAIGQTVTWGCRGANGGTSTTTADACSATRSCPNISCGVANGSSQDSTPAENLCSPNASLLNPPGVTMNSTGHWNWFCESEASEHGCPNVPCQASSCLVDLPYELQPYVYFDGDGTPNDATMTVTCPNVCCNVDGAEGAVTVCDGTPRQIPVRPGQNVYDMECWFDDGNRSKDDDENGVQKSSPISTMCTARSCNSQGTCQATPQAANSADACTSTCNSDADCSRGRMIETRP